MTRTCRVLGFALLGLMLSGSAAFAQWRSEGWTLVGETIVMSRQGEPENITVGRALGRFTKIIVVVRGASVELYDFKVNFRRGEPFDPNLRHRFRDGSASAPITLPGEARVIESITFWAKDLPDRGKPTVQVWGEQASRFDEEPQPQPAQAADDDCLELGWKNNTGRWQYHRAWVEQYDERGRVHIRYDHNGGELELRVSEKERGGEDVFIFKGKWTEGQSSWGRAFLKMEKGHHRAKGWYTYGDQDEHFDMELRDCRR